MDGARKTLFTQVSELLFIFEKQAGLHRALIDLLNQEYQHMGSMDVVAISECARSKEVFIQEIFQCEVLRRELLTKFAAQNKLSVDDLSLTTLFTYTSEADSKKLTETRAILVALVEQATELNRRNMDFAAESLDRIEILKRNVLGIQNDVENYSQSGSRQPMTEQGGRLLTTEA